MTRLLDNPEDEIERIKRDAWGYAPIADEFERVVREEQMERDCAIIQQATTVVLRTGDELTNRLRAAWAEQSTEADSGDEKPST